MNKKIYNALIDSHHQEMPPQVTPGRHLLIQDTYYSVSINYRARY